MIYLSILDCFYKFVSQFIFLKVYQIIYISILSVTREF